VNNADKKKFKAQAHALKPVIMIGHAGLTAAVLTEIELALDFHELIKIRIRAEREDREHISHEICTATKAELLQKIGQISVIYRKNPQLK
jgi:RNA-binding protein